METLAQPVLKE
jgi:hypothetical protein